MPFEYPATPRDGNALDRESNGHVCDGQPAVLEHGYVCELVRPLDFSSSFPPQAHNIDELGIGREELGKCVHVVPIPALGECLDDLRYFGDWIGHRLFSLMGG